MAQQTSALCEPMTGFLNIHPPTHPHLLCVIQQGLTHRQTQPQAQTQTHILASLQCDQLLQPTYHQKQKEGKEKQAETKKMDKIEI